MRKLMLALPILAVLACSPVEYKLKVEDFAKKMKEPGTVLVDVRTPEEHAEERIANSLNIDYNGSDFEAKIKELDKGKTYLLYCRSGGRSGRSAEIMNQLGFKEVYDLRGGINSWRVHEMPTEGTASKAKSDGESVVPFKKALKSDKLVMVDFTAVWCGPCQKMKPSIVKLRKELAEKVLITEVDVDQQKQIAADYQISSMPTLVFFKNGKEVSRTIGYRTEADLRVLINSVLEQNS